jgi:hypothetical protein
MRLDWILDVLTDIHDFATRNDLPRLAEQIETTLHIARLEIAEAPPCDDPDEEDDMDDGDPPPPATRH